MILPETLELTRLLTGRGVRCWLIGGNAVELVVGRDIRGHDDVDFLVAARDAERAVDALCAAGFTHAHGSLETGDVFYRRDALLVDLVPIDDTTSPPRATGTLSNLAFPPGFLAPHVVWHQGTPITTLTPEMHLRMKTIVAAFFGVELREKDRLDEQHLRAHLEAMVASSATRS